jgi:hypothetical protein
MHPTAVELDEEEHVQPLQPDRLDGEEVDRDHAMCLGSQELAPGEPRALPGRPEASLAKQLAHGRGRYRDAEPAKLADDPLIAPPSVLTREAQHELADLAPNWRAADSTGYVQRFATSRRCHRSSVVGVTTNERQLDRGSSRLAAARNTRSVALSSARPA